MTDIAKFELVDRPRKVSDPVYHPTPERLVQTILDTEKNGKAVRFTTDYITAKGIYNRLSARLRTRGLRLKQHSERARVSDKRAPYDVVMWVESRSTQTIHQDGD
jgi:hypothetical protein